MQVSVISCYTIQRLVASFSAGSSKKLKSLDGNLLSEKCFCLLDDVGPVRAMYPLSAQLYIYLCVCVLGMSVCIFV